MNEAELDNLIDHLTLEEQVSLLAGFDNWHTVALPQHGIPAMRVTDGPAGARGTSFNGPDSVNIPCGTALGATFDPALVEELGGLLAKETRAKGARVLLAPTVNLHRTPVGGRNFECQSEDPYLSARITVGYVRGLQEGGVAACVKHFVGNDTEFERMSIDNRIDEVTLREMYLRPFEAAVTEAGALSIMTAYNRINGPFAADSKELITDVLRNEWGFDGIVMSDWFGLHSTVEGIEAGLDLEMPGPTRDRGDKLVAAVRDGRVDAALVRDAARRIVRFMDRIGALADGGPGPELTRDEPADRVLIRRAGAAGMVLLKNDNGALPFDTAGLRRVAVIGPNADHGRIMGGGSALVNPVHEVQPLDALRARLGGSGVELLHAPGCHIHRTLPVPERRWVSDATLDYFVTAASYQAGDAPAHSEPLTRFERLWQDDAGDLRIPDMAVRATFTLTPDVSGPWEIGVTAAGFARVLVDGELLFDNAAAKVGGSFFGIGRDQATGIAALTAGVPAVVTVEYLDAGGSLLRGLNIGVVAPVLTDLLEDAANLAATCDAAIVIVGTNHDWESEGYDRSSIDLPGRQDDLIREVAKVSPRTIVVVNAGSPYAMPWLNEVDAVIYAWFPGQEFGDALVDVLVGDVDAGGRLPITLPRRYEDTPAFEHHPGRNGVGRYLEGRLMGYRSYDTLGRDPLFPFGHGLSFADLAITAATFDASGPAIVATVENRSTRNGTEVVQVYASDPDGPGTDNPFQQLVGFAKVEVPASSSIEVRVPLDARWASHWDVESHGWAVRPGTRELRVGQSSRNTPHTIITTV